MADPNTKERPTATGATDVPGVVALGDDLRTAWHRWVDMLVPHRPALYGYCRRLTRNLWDAEDLAQDTLLRAFGQWGVTTPPVRDPRAYLLRTATNVWIDTLRRRETEERARTSRTGDLPTPSPPFAEPPSVETASELRGASARLLDRLSPQEQAAFVLKEAFDMPHEEIATLLATTTGAVKAALHRGRERLRNVADSSSGADTPARAVRTQRAPTSPELVDRFIALCHAKDVPGLVALLVDGVSAENVGNSFHVGLDPNEGVPHFLHKVVYGHAEWPPEFAYEAQRFERAEIDGEPIALSFGTRRGKERLEVVFRFEEENGRISRIRAYGFCPDTIRAVGEALGIQVRTGIYRAPTPAPGARWPEP